MADIWEFDAIGTRWQVQTPAALDAPTRARVAELIDGFDRAWSRFRADSLVTDLAADPRAVPAPPDAADMIALYRDLSEATAGAVNPLIGAALAARGYDAQYSLRDRGARATASDWGELLRVEADVLTLAEPALIDVGAVGKGRLVDLVAGALGAVPGDVVVDAGGDIAVRGATERIALEHPYRPARAVGVWSVTDAALCASGITRRAWGDGLHHVLDARTGVPVRSYAATWAVASDAMTADAVSTALFFDGGPRFAHERDAQWVRMTTDGRLEWSPRCEAELFV